MIVELRVYHCLPGRLPALHERFQNVTLPLWEKHGIEPMVTISHYETPLNLARTYGGWTNRAMIAFYERYCQVLFERFGSRVKYWLTFNEINSVLHEPFLSGGIPTPKDDINGSEVGRVYWQENDLERIKTYCQKDVLAIAQLMRRYHYLPLIPDDCVDYTN